MQTLPRYWIPPTPTVGALQPNTEAQAAVWIAARVAFVGAVGAVVGGIAMPQLAGEYFDWMGGAVIGGLFFGAVSAWI